MSMKRKIFSGVFAISIFVLMLTMLIVLGVMWNYVSGQSRERLVDESHFISLGTETSGMEYLEGIGSDSRDDSRITWIDSDGTVLYDNQADPSKMENHADRQEVADAIKNGTGESVRYSSTLSEKTRYYAVKLSDGSILRLSETQRTLFSLMLSALPSLSVLIAVVIIISLLMAARLSRRITEPVNSIDLDEPHKSEVYTELTPLLDKIADQNAQINAQMDELMEQHAVRKEFTANVTHELKTPLTSILGFAEIMKSGLVKPDDMQHFAEKIYDEAQRLLSLIADILRLSKLESDTDFPEREDIDILSVSEMVAERLEEFAARYGVRLTVSGEHAVVRVIPQILDEVIFNITENAIKYNVPGGSADIRSGYEGTSPCVVISDTGQGISEEDLPRIFERFYRADKAHTGAVPGTGLGLSIVKHGVNVMGAEISVDSEQGRGTTMKILF